MWSRVKHIFNNMGESLALSNSGEMLSKKQKDNVLNIAKQNTSTLKKDHHAKK